MAVKFTLPSGIIVEVDNTKQALELMTGFSGAPKAAVPVPVRKSVPKVKTSPKYAIVKRASEPPLKDTELSGEEAESILEEVDLSTPEVQSTTSTRNAAQNRVREVFEIYGNGLTIEEITEHIYPDAPDAVNNARSVLSRMEREGHVHRSSDKKWHVGIDPLVEEAMTLQEFVRHVILTSLVPISYDDVIAQVLTKRPDSLRGSIQAVLSKIKVDPDVLGVGITTSGPRGAMVYRRKGIPLK